MEQGFLEVVFFYFFCNLARSWTAFMKRKAFFDLAFAKVLISRECEKQNVSCALGLQESVPSAHVQSQVILGSFGICLMSFKHDYRFYLEFFETKRRHESRRNHNTAKPRRSRIWAL